MPEPLDGIEATLPAAANVRRVGDSSNGATTTSPRGSAGAWRRAARR